MGLTNRSVGRSAIDRGLTLTRTSPHQKIIALAGNPNVGKSTVFNGLTGLHQHTGNWPGKTVSNAQGSCHTDRYEYLLVDIPGTYSLMAHSAEEEVARDFLCFGAPDAVVVVCDATCLERNLNLVLQITELCDRVVVCLNLMDEAKRHGIHIRTDLLAERLGVKVVTTVGHNKRSLRAVTAALDALFDETPTPPTPIHYPVAIERAVAELRPALEGLPNERWLSLRILEKDESFLRSLKRTYTEERIRAACDAADEILSRQSLSPEAVRDDMVGALSKTADHIAEVVVSRERPSNARHDRLLTHRVWGYPTMILLLIAVFWLTISGANYPSALLSNILFALQDHLTTLFHALNAPDWLHGALVLGAYRVLAWVVAVMLPPMAIFFPLFTLLEDIGYLPRIAFHLDGPFHRCRACGKQALTMCMGFGCNAAGVVGCRIIDSPRERLLAILTNNFVPCNGRFPTLITLLTLFFVGATSSVMSALSLTLVIIFGVLITFGVTRLLSATLLRGLPSSFTLELPPFRRPQIGRILIRSLHDRILFVLGRAAAVAAPAGLIIWLTANVTIGDSTLLAHAAAFLDPFAQFIGLDGAILLAFILGFPANEIVLPIVLMIYTASGTLTDISSVTALKDILLANGWTGTTAACTVLFSLLHWPCSTTLLTIRRETGSVRWTAVAFLLPTLVGLAICALVNVLFS